MTSATLHPIPPQAVTGGIAQVLDTLGKMPVLAIGAEKRYGARIAEDFRFVADDVTGAVIANSGHWIMEEQPGAAIALITAFLEKE